MRKFGIALVFAICATSLWPAQNEIANRGQDLFARRCTGCHSLDGIKVGPALRGVLGRRAGDNPLFQYSEGLKKAQLVWDEPTLDRWLADPEGLVPDNDMAFRLNDAGERAAIIAYLKQLSAKRGQH